MNTRKEQIDAQMQECIEKGFTATDPAGTVSFDQEDLAAYQVLFDTLKEEPTTGPSYGFSRAVIAKIQTRKDYAFMFKWNIILPLALLLSLGIIYLAAVYLNNGMANSMIRLIAGFKWQLVFAMTCFFMIQYLDQLLIKRRTIV
jgi:hypothetical protein